MPRVNGKEYPYTAAGKAAAKQAEQNKKKSPKGKPKKAAPAKPKPGTGRYPGPGYDETGPSVPRPKKTPKRIPNAPSKKMNQAIPGNKGIDLSAAARKFIMTMPPVGPAIAAGKAGMAVGRAINDRINPPTRQMKRLSTGTVGDMLRKQGRPGPTAKPKEPLRPLNLDQLRKMNEMPKRKPKTLLPKKPGR
jgi:hypothetical protein